MTTESKDKKADSRGEQRRSERPRRRLVDLTLMAGTDRRERKGDRRKSDLEDTAERLSNEATERPADETNEEES